MKSHYEAIVCPNCGKIETAEVLHTFPHWDYTHICTYCNHAITESEQWNSLGMMFHSDCKVIFKTMKSNSKDIVIITDPPYGVRKEEKWDDAELFKRRIKGWLDECFRVAEHTIVWFCANKMYPYIFRAIKPEQFLREHHWNKPKGSQFNGASNNNIWYSSEPILVFTKDRDKTVKNYDTDSKWNYDDLTYGTVAKKIWGHPTTKPVGLMAELIMHYTKPTDIVFDPFGGSGSTIEAAIKTGRRFIYIEQSPLPDKPITDENGDNPDHFGNALKRIKRIHDENDMFGYKKQSINTTNEELFGETDEN